MALRDDLIALLRPYGLDALADAATARFREGMPTASQLELWLEGQSVVQQQFKPVFERRAKGLSPISISDVVEYRQQASQLASYYDLPREFLDTDRLLTDDVSVSELSERIQTVADVIGDGANAGVLAQYQAWGYTPGDVIAMALDPDSGVAAAQRRQSAVRVGAQAARQANMSISEAEAQGLVAQGVTENQAQQGFGTLGAYSEVTQNLIGEDADVFTRDQQLGVVAGTQAATSELEKRARRRQSVFEGGGSLAAGNEGVFGAGAAGGR